MSQRDQRIAELLSRISELETQGTKREELMSRIAELEARIAELVARIAELESATSPPTASDPAEYNSLSIPSLNPDHMGHRTELEELRKVKPARPDKGILEMTVDSESLPGTHNP
jgi:DNA repair exonuclease SbcCD ATPase subunit